MKNIALVLAIIISIILVVSGKIHWDNKIEATTKIDNKVSSERPATKNESNEKKEEVVVNEVDSSDIVKYTKNLPQEIVSKIEGAVSSKEPVHLIIMGSASTPEAQNGWPTLLKTELLQTYGEEIFKITIKEFADKTSINVIQEELYQEVVDLHPDILLLEPFILADNGLVTIEDRLTNLTTMLEEFYNENPELTVLLQPANPLQGAVHYPKEVAELQRYAESNEYIYLNHWTAWPDHQSTEIAPYLAEDMPNDLGHQLWADYLIDYFISK
ncbi:SGNH/GDSL hydrolase family protein [Fredinandcohnia humi]